MRSKFLLAAALVVGTASTAAAQLSITPFVGSMVPMRALVLDTAGGTYFRMTASTIYGLRLTKEMSPSLALQFQGGIGKGGFEAIGGTTVLDLSTAVYFADVRARFRVLGNDDTNLGLLAGAGWTQFTLGLFEAAHALNDSTNFKGTVTGILGFGLKARMGGSTHLAVDLTDRIHQQGVEFNGNAGLIEQLQHDVTFSAGLNFPLGH